MFDNNLWKHIHYFSKEMSRVKISKQMKERERERKGIK
jgi:hypothetical protein